ncbi:MAG TPA: hypothetical protein VFN48_05605 [Solirubrobacteraceae bacterium]|nr:hypothetical protein [Solirubrobacteraceae bacterium]
MSGVVGEGASPGAPGRRRRQGRAPARTALAGNPSDGYGGAVLALTLDMLGARVNLTQRSAETRAAVGEVAEAEVAEAEAGVAEAEAGTALIRRARRADSPQGGRLTRAVLARAQREFGIDTRGYGVRMVTSIPRSVGLGGSSAIVIATLRALLDAHRVTLGALELAELALSIEVDDLGIAAGLQDRLVQVHGGLMFMDFSGPRAVAERLPYDRLWPLLVAWRAETAAGSGIVHGDLRSRWSAGDPVVTAGMARLAGHARAARVALLNADHAAFAAAVDGSFDVRAELMDLDPAHVAMVQAGRAAGAAVNYTGSGGAVVCACEDSHHRDHVAEALRALGAETVAA